MLELRPRVRRRLGNARLDDACAEALEAGGPCLGGVARLGLAASPIPGGCRSRPTVSPRAAARAPALPVSTDHMRATSSTLRAIGPTVSRVGQRGKTPSVEIETPLRLEPDGRARGGGKPDRAPRVRAERELAEAGCERRGGAARRAPVVLPGCAGLWHVPCHGLSPSTLQANSGRCVFPTSTAPASRSRWTAAPSAPGRARRTGPSRTSSARRRCRRDP